MMAPTPTRPAASTAPAAPTAVIEGYRVRPGLRIPWDSNHERVSFSFFAVCDAAAPPAWHGEVLLAGRVLHRTPTYETHQLAGRAAERALVERLVALFSW
jgi:hypothetical protein